MRVFTRQQVREVDRLAVDRYHIPGIVLMENAARGLTDMTLRFLFNQWRNKFADDAARWPAPPDDFPRGVKILIVAGGGNNGGDGFAAARHLHNHGVACTLAVTRPLDDYKGDARTNLDIVRAMKLRMIETSSLESIEEHHLILDGLFGTGLSAPPRPPADALIRTMNIRHEPIVAIDIPSGLDCDTGEPLSVAVRAAMTVTFVGTKLGFTKPQSRAYTGQVQVADIGVPRELVEELGSHAPM